MSVGKVATISWQDFCLHRPCPDTSKSSVFCRFMGYRIVCPLHDSSPDAVELVLQGNATVTGRQPLEAIPMQRQGSLAVCTGPALSWRGVEPSWLEYHKDIGVDHVRIFVPIGRDTMVNRFNLMGLPDHLIYYLRSFNGQVTGAPFKFVTGFDYVSYMTYSPPAVTWYWSQFTIMHACWYSLRHAYDFVLTIDFDEYLAMNVDDSLDHWLEGISQDTGAVLVQRFIYPARCQQVSVGDPPNPAHLLIREETTDGAHPQFPKLILRPSKLILATNHKPMKLSDDCDKVWEAPESDIELKHFRDTDGHCRRHTHKSPR